MANFVFASGCIAAAFLFLVSAQRTEGTRHRILGVPLSNDVVGTSPQESFQCSDRDTFRNMQFIMNFYRRIFEEKQFDLVDDFVNEYFNYEAAGVSDREEFKRVLESTFSNITLTIDLKNVAAEGSLAWTQLHSIRESEGIVFPEYGSVHLLEFDCEGLIREVWEISSYIDTI